MVPFIHTVLINGLIELEQCWALDYFQRYNSIIELQQLQIDISISFT